MIVGNVTIAMLGVRMPRQWPKHFEVIAGITLLVKEKTN